MNTQTNSNIGLRGKKPKNPFFPLHSRPKPKEKGRVDFGLPPHFYLLGFHAHNSCFQASITSKSLLSSPLSHSRPHLKHTHTFHKFSQRTFKKTLSFPPHNFEILRSFQEDLSS